MIGNIDMDSSNFAYTATIKLDEIPKCQAHDDFPGVADLAVNSRNFANYFDCSNSVKEFMSSVVVSINLDLSKDDQFVLTTEVNPVYSGVDTKSKDWGEGELARLWMFENKQVEANTIRAVGQARVFMMSREPTTTVN